MTLRSKMALSFGALFTVILIVVSLVRTFGIPFTADRGSYGEAHASTYVPKLLDLDKLVGLMKDLGFYWLAWNANPYPEERR